jgi:hypothetical protein
MNQSEIGAAEQRVMQGLPTQKPRGWLIMTKTAVEESCENGVCLAVEIEESDHKWHCDIHWPSGDGPGAKALRTQLSQRLLAHEAVTLQVL